MKAKTKNQKRVVSLDFKLNSKHLRAKSWATQEVLENIGVRYKSGVLHCLKCGNHWNSNSQQAWHDEIAEIKCPTCKNKLKVKQTQKRNFKHQDFFTVVDTVKEYQRTTTYEIIGYFKCKEPARYCILKCFSIYINEKGKQEVMGKIDPGGYNYGYQGAYELRHSNVISRKYNVEGFVYPKWKLQDFMINAGFDAYSYAEGKHSVAESAKVLCTFPHMETISKLGNKSLEKYCWRFPDKAIKYWNTIKICIRNKYDLDRPQTYFDMIDALDFYKKDLRNKHFVCPENLRETHDFWINKRQKLRRKIEKENAIKNKIAEAKRREKTKESYRSRMSKFHDFELINGDIKIVPFLSLEEVQKAGGLMRNCIYKSTHYWENADNLLLGTYVNNKLIETTQFCLERKITLHSYGKLNEESKQHNKILKTIESNHSKIFNCLRRKPKKAKVAELA
tara:strand:- start:471 stop:1817 length:1347 start_codon:yes stop_codon:yes gene_type:complete